MADSRNFHLVHRIARMIYRTWLRTACLVFCCAFLSAQLSFRLRQSTTAEMIDNDRAVLAGRATLPEFQNRALAPATFVTIQKLSGGLLDDLQTWKAMRLFSALLAF